MEKITPETLEAFEQQLNYNRQVESHNNAILDGLPDEVQASIELNVILEDVELNGEMGIYPEPKGEKQNESYTFFTEIYVDQWTVGMNGDSWEGHIYAKYAEEEYLMIPYKC